MEFSNTNKPKTDIGKFITETFRKTISASKSRLKIFFAIVFLQFLAVPGITILLNFFLPGTYEGITKRMAYEAWLIPLMVLTKYLLLLVLLLISPAEHTGRRRLAKYIVLIGSLYIWIFFDLGYLESHSDDNKQELAKQSFKENVVPLYCRVVFSSYKRLESNPKRHNREVAVAAAVSSRTNGYIVILQPNDSIYTYAGLKIYYHSFNDYTHDFYDSTFSTHIQKKTPDLVNCLQFIYTFPDDPDTLPKLPAVGRYVKIMYDPIQNGIEMYTDPATGVTPTFDSIP